ncbi:MAG: toll-Interleukin receptor [Chthoniobacterales bacterium]
MGFLRESDIRTRAQRRARAEGVSVEEALRRAAHQRRSQYDIFLSQTIRDAEIVLGVYDLLTEKGYAVFCDWIDAPDANRNEITPANAALVREMMSISDTLLFLDTENADQSLWMCWELGWFDGGKGPVGILPVVTDQQRYYRGREFLGLYPYLEIDEEGRLKVVRPVVAGSSGIMLFEAPNSRSFDSWRTESRDHMRPRVVGAWRRP